MTAPQCPRQRLPHRRRTRTRTVNNSPGAASELARQTRAVHPNQGTENGNTTRKEDWEAEETENRSIPTPTSPDQCRPANTPANTSLSRIQTRSSVVMRSSQATRTGSQRHRQQPGCPR
ncbi:hypothetical protein EVAR_66086_1 [Eumeta japonica]|uniref:Uncharacterized protein n=1 Tax=Eumeta variegata TaxID=151549 RepID=A0A4C1ZSP5_EUMVA|nr:hypothetical protein EVAR_66086_1 [Eumeta japonica]